VVRGVEQVVLARLGCELRQVGEAGDPILVEVVLDEAVEEGDLE
jgi:hypothetical protein